MLLFFGDTCDQGKPAIQTGRNPNPMAVFAEVVAKRTRREQEDEMTALAQGMIAAVSVNVIARSGCRYRLGLRAP